MLTVRNASVGLNLRCSDAEQTLLYCRKSSPALTFSAPELMGFGWCVCAVIPDLFFRLALCKWLALLYKEEN